MFRIAICDDELISSFKNVLYFESELHMINAYELKKGKMLYRKRDTINKIEKELACFGFIRCHHSYLVNKVFVINYNKHSLFLIDGTCIPISRSRCKDVLNKLSTLN